MAYNSIPEMYTDQIVSVGNVRRMYFHCLVELDTGVFNWYYFGTTAAEKPPTTADPVFESTFVQFPQAMDDIDKHIADNMLYELGRMAGFKREGITNPGD